MIRCTKGGSSRRGHLTLRDRTTCPATSRRERSTEAGGARIPWSWLLHGLSATAQEPPVLTGTWVGTWWVGKYEEPIEFDLTQDRQDLVGQVRMWGYPRVDSSRATAIVRAPVTGTVEGQRITLT